MDAGTRGTIIAGRYQCAGDPRRGVLLDAVDLDADTAVAGCRVIAVPGDAAAVDAWRTAWEAAAAAGLPALRELIADEDGERWAVLAPAIGAPDPGYPADAERQAHAIAGALVRAGLDVGDVRALVCVDGRLRVDQFVGLASGAQPGAEARLVGLLPAAALVDDDPTPSVRRRPGSAPRRARRRWLVPLGIALVLGATAAVLAQPTRSAAPATTVAAPLPDVLLPATAPLVRAEPAPPRPRRPRRPAAAQPRRDPPPAATAPTAPVEEPVADPVAALPAPTAVDLPVADGGLPVGAG